MGLIDLFFNAHSPERERIAQSMATERNRAKKEVKKIESEITEDFGGLYNSNPKKKKKSNGKR